MQSRPWTRLLAPFAMYTAAQTGLNCAINLVQSRGDVYSSVDDAATNLPFIAVTNLGYAKCVDYITRKLGPHGRIGANAFSLAVTGAFYTYGALTNDNNPALPAAIVGTIGIVLTNQQVSGIQKDLERRMTIEPYSLESKRV